MSPSRLSIGLCFGLATIQPAWSQTGEVRLPNVVSCPDCAIVLDSPVRLGDQEGEGAFSSWPFGFQHSIAVDRRGTAYVGVRDGPDFAPWMFDSRSGRYLGRLGRVGGGPGEFRFPTLIQALPGDSLFILDQNEHRYSILAPATRRWVRGGPLPGASYDGLALSDGTRFVLNTRLRTRESAGLPLHTFTPKGQALRSFGADTAREDPRDEGGQIRLLALAGDSGIWSARHLYAYELRLYTPAGDLRLTLRRNASWFPDYSRADVRPVSPTVPPKPFITALDHSADGMLWVAVAVPDARWSRGLSPPLRGERGETWYRYEDWERVFDTQIEVIDPVRGRIVTSQRIDQFVTAFLPGKLATARVQDDQPFLMLYRRSLKGLPGSSYPNERGKG